VVGKEQQKNTSSSLKQFAGSRNTEECATVNNINSATSCHTVARDEVDKLINNDRNIVHGQWLTAQIICCLL